MLHLAKAYTQIPVNSEDVPKAAITILFGLFAFPFRSLDLRDSGQTFQCFSEVLQGLSFCFAHVGDIVVYSTSVEQHRDHLKEAFELQLATASPLTLTKVCSALYRSTSSATRPPQTESSLYPTA